MARRKINPLFTFNFTEGNEQTSVTGQGSLFDFNFGSEPAEQSTSVETDNFILSLFDNNSHTEEESVVKSDTKSTAQNFKIKDFDVYKGSEKERFNRNIEAIKILKLCESENRPATAEEQEKLALYNGWGGLKNSFHDKETVDILKELLNEEEYKSAKASVLSAFYTSPKIIQGIYKYLERCNFKKGNILEPSMGIGNFFGVMPEEWQESSNLYGVEIDSITGRIAKLLYPNAKIEINGYEKTNYPDNFFDVAIGNIPFGEFGVADIRYDRLNLLIHDYFITKTIDKLRPNGVMIFITSKGTLDKKNSKVRQYVASKCDLLGAVRLPNNAFKNNAGTDVVSDIIVLRKRESYNDSTNNNWINTVELTDGDTVYSINQYYQENPQQILGELKTFTNQYGKTDTTVKATDEDITEALAKAFENIAYTDLNFEDSANENKEGYILADENAKNFSYCIRNNSIYYRRDSYMTKVELTPLQYDRLYAMINIRDTVNHLLNIQVQNCTDDALENAQFDLNFQYDNFVKKFGRICNKTNERAFKEDVSLPLLRSLEMYDDEGNFKRKADIFSKRTVKPVISITHCDTSVDALGVCIAQKGKVDIEFIQKLTGFDKVKILSDLQGVIFANPTIIDTNGDFCYETSDEYLSGNIREKLIIAKNKAKEDSAFDVNVSALTKVLPAPLSAEDITISLGSTWVPVEIFSDFIYEIFRIREKKRYTYRPHRWETVNTVKVEYSKATATYTITNKSSENYNVQVSDVYGTKRKNGMEIILNSLNQKMVEVYDTIYVTENDGSTKEKRVLNAEETQLAQAKQEAINSKFRDWVFEDIDRRQMLVNLYNEKFNSIRPREFNGSHIAFEGMNPTITLKTHQKNAIARAIYGGNCGFFHEVGAGKTLEICCSIMEGKKLGKLTKAMVVVPKHLTQQFAKEFLWAYPTANILATTTKDFSKENRRMLISKIATGNFDAIIIGHSQFEKIPLSDEHMKEYIEQSIAELDDAIAELDNEENRFQLRQLELQKKKLQVKLEKIEEHLSNRQDSVISFEQLGIDKLCVDEAHYFKNLQLSTKMGNVAGISTSAAEKSSDLYYKCKYLDSITNNTGIIFATGTPVSNSMTEIYTMMKYLMAKELQEYELTYFDEWASTFGETIMSFELAPEGTGYHTKKRFARFYNLPELINLFKLCADIKVSDELDLDVPNCKMELIEAEPTDAQKAYVESLSERATAIHDGNVDSSIDNMLKITSDGRKCGLDMRLINDCVYTDEPDTKVNKCVNKVFEIWKNTESHRLTQCVFCDSSTPSKDRFDVYNEIKDKLINLGVPSDEIAFIHDYPRDNQKEDLFKKVRAGVIRILFGSTAKLGVGTNIQTKLVAIHDLDIPWRPSDLIQRLGRMVRQGNTNENVVCYRYVTKGTFDAYLYQILEQKQRFISQIMTSKNPVRPADNIDEATLDFAEVKALCAGNPEVAEKMRLDNEVKKLQAEKNAFKAARYRLEEELQELPKTIENNKKRIENLNRDYESVKTVLQQEQTENVVDDAEGKESKASTFAGITINGVFYDNRKDANVALIQAYRNLGSGELEFSKNCVGEYLGFKIHIGYNYAYNHYEYQLTKNWYYYGDLSMDNSTGNNVLRIENSIKKIQSVIENTEKNLEIAQKRYAEVENEINKSFKSFSKEEELRSKLERLNELNLKLSLNKSNATA